MAEADTTGEKYITLEEIEGKTDKIFKQFARSQGPLVLGRAGKSDSAARDPTAPKFRSEKTRVMSNKHAELSWEDGVPMIKDIKSTNGVRIKRDNEWHACTPLVAYRIKQDDEIVFGKPIQDPDSSSEVMCEPLTVRVGLSDNPFLTIDDSNEATPELPAIPLERVRTIGDGYLQAPPPYRASPECEEPAATLWYAGANDESQASSLETPSPIRVCNPNEESSPIKRGFGITDADAYMSHEEPADEAEAVPEVAVDALQIANQVAEPDQQEVDAIKEGLDEGVEGGDASATLAEDVHDLVLPDGESSAGKESKPIRDFAAAELIKTDNVPSISQSPSLLHMACERDQSFNAWLAPNPSGSMFCGSVRYISYRDDAIVADSKRAASAAAEPLKVEMQGTDSHLPSPVSSIRSLDQLEGTPAREEAIEGELEGIHADARSFQFAPPSDYRAKFMSHRNEEHEDAWREGFPGTALELRGTASPAPSESSAAHEEHAQSEQRHDVTTAEEHDEGLFDMINEQDEHIKHSETLVREEPEAASPANDGIVEPAAPFVDSAIELASPSLEMVRTLEAEDGIEAEDGFKARKGVVSHTQTRSAVVDGFDIAYQDAFSTSYSVALAPRAFLVLAREDLGPSNEANDKATGIQHRDQDVQAQGQHLSERHTEDAAAFASTAEPASEHEGAADEAGGTVSEGLDRARGRGGGASETTKLAQQGSEIIIRQDGPNADPQAQDAQILGLNIADEHDGSARDVADCAVTSEASEVPSEGEYDNEEVDESLEKANSDESSLQTDSDYESQEDDEASESEKDASEAEDSDASQSGSSSATRFSRKRRFDDVYDASDVDDDDTAAREYAGAAKGENVIPAGVPPKRRRLDLPIKSFSLGLLTGVIGAIAGLSALDSLLTLE